MSKSTENLSIEARPVRLTSRTKVGFVWYYGGDVRNGRVSHGSTVRPRDVRIVSQKGHVIQRGGFGFRSRSGG